MNNPPILYGIGLFACFALGVIAARYWLGDSLKKPIVQRTVNIFAACNFACIAIYQVHAQRMGVLLASFLAANASFIFFLAFATEHRGPDEKPRTRPRISHLLLLITLFCLQLGVHEAIRRTQPPEASLAPAAPLANPLFLTPQPPSPPGGGP